MAGGTRVDNWVPYYAQRDKEKLQLMPGKRGFYPTLMLLGIHDRCSPRLASEISMMAAALSSIKEAEDMLLARGCPLDFKTIRNIVKRFAARARLSQENGVSLDEEMDFRGLRVVVSIDGGRIRIREDKKGRRTKKNRKRYTTDWREPKLFIIYAVDENGRMSRKFCPLLDASMNGPDELFALLGFYLGKMNAVHAESITFLADGALWIWDRIGELQKSFVGLVTIYLGLDFYHAAQHLSEFIEFQKWPPGDGKRYFNQYRHLLQKGQIGKVIEFLEITTKGTEDKDLLREKTYFIKNRHRMEYGILSRLNLPIGSGAVESSIRRVINLRLKGPGIFWHEETANEMLMLRCYYKAGRWGLIEKMASESAMARVD